MVKHYELLLHSLFFPKKLATYRLLSIGKVIQYVFILITIITIFSFIQFLTGIEESAYSIQQLQEYIKDIKWLLYPFAFLVLYVTSTTVVFIRISIYALVGVGLLKILKRRGEYRHMWRTSSFAITWSTILSILSPYFSIPQFIETVISIVITLILLTIAAKNYPKISKK